MKARPHLVRKCGSWDCYKRSMSNLAPFMEPGAAVQISGDVVQQASGAWLASGIVPNISGQSALISGQNVVVSSGAISVVSGSITVNSGQIAIMSGLPFAFTQGSIISGGGGTNFSGAGIQPIALMGYDYSGQVWKPIASAGSGYLQTTLGLTVGGNTSAFLQQAASVDGLGPAQSFVAVNALGYGYDTMSGGIARFRVSASGDAFRLRVSTEGQAPTYSVHMQQVTIVSGAAGIAPLMCLFNFGSGTAIQSGSAYKIKSLYINPEPNNPASGFPVKFDVLRCTGFSGGGTLVSGLGQVTVMAIDTRDPGYSGTLFAPTIQRNANSGVVVDGVYFSTTMNTMGQSAGLASAFVSGWNDAIGLSLIQDYLGESINLIASRNVDTKEIIIRSGYGFAVCQSSGGGYTAITSGNVTFDIHMIYSVEGMTYTA